MGLSLRNRLRGKLTQLFLASSLQGWLAVVFLAFLALIITSVGLTFWGLDTQKQDAIIINLAGRQRMLIQQMGRLAVEYQEDREAHYQADLAQTADTFSQTLTALRQGGAITDYTGRTLVVVPPTDASLIAELEKLDGSWQAFQGQLEPLTAAGGNVDQAAIQGLDTSALQLVAEADQVVQVYEDLSATKIARLHRIQFGFLVGGLGLLGLGWWLTRATIVQPLERLDRSAGQIGAGDLEHPVSAGGPVEIQRLGVTLDTMRAELRSSNQELVEWVNTLEHKVKQRTQELEALAAVSQDISSHLNIAEVLKSVTEKAQLLLGSEVAYLCLLDDHGQQLYLHSAIGPEAATLKSASAVPPEMAHRVLLGQAAVPCGVGNCPGFCEIMAPAYRVSHLAAPLRTGDKVIGALCVGRSQAGRFGPESTRVLTQLAGAATVALENSQLYEHAEHRAALEERQRIASEIHDGLLQTLSYLRWMVALSGQQLAEGDVSKALQTFENIERAERQAEGEIRRAIASLQEELPGRYTLQEMVAQLVAEAASHPSPRVQWQNRVMQPVILPRAESEQVLRVTREALLNARHHGQAETVVVSFDKVEHELMVSVTDDGAGFVVTPEKEAEPLPGERAHFGLKIMAARAARLGGQLAIASEPGKGTRVTLRWVPGKLAATD